MFEVETRLTGDVTAGLDAFEAKIKESIIFSGAAAMAKVLYDEVSLNASGERAKKAERGFIGPLQQSPPGRVTGNLANSIYRVYSPEKSSDGVKTYRISWNHSKAPHGHLLEFGTSKKAAHPFVRPAFDHVQEAIKAGNARMKERMAGG